MAYYIDIDQDGKEVKIGKKRGPTLKGYKESEPGVWKKDPTFTTEAKKDYKYVRFNKDGSTEVKDIGKGRRPLGYSKCEVSGGKYIAVPIIQVIKSEQSWSMEDCLSYINRLTTQKKYGITELSGCGIKADCPIPFLKNNQNISRINLVNRKGEIHVWTNSYQENQPDVIIKNAIIRSVSDVQPSCVSPSQP